jgi:hypothetical protein
VVGSLLVGSVAAFLIVVALTPSDVQISTGEKVIFILNIPQSSCAEPPCPPGSGVWLLRWQRHLAGVDAQRRLRFAFEIALYRCIHHCARRFIFPCLKHLPGMVRTQELKSKMMAVHHLGETLASKSIETKSEKSEIADVILLHIWSCSGQRNAGDCSVIALQHFCFRGLTAQAMGPLAEGGRLTMTGWKGSFSYP